MPAEQHLVPLPPQTAIQNLHKKHRGHFRKSKDEEKLLFWWGEWLTHKHTTSSPIHINDEGAEQSFAQLTEGSGLHQVPR